MLEALPDDEPGGSSTRLVHFATVTSRVDAFVLTSVLEHEGIRVWIGGEHHAGVDPISHALGGYRLEIFEVDIAHASALASELGWPNADVVGEGQKLAVIKFFAALAGMQLFIAIPAFIVGWLPAVMLGMIGLNVLGVPVDPRGRNEFHLASEERA